MKWSAIFERLGPVSETCKKLNLASEGNAFMESAPVRQLQPMLTLPLNVYQQPKSAGSVTKKKLKASNEIVLSSQGLFLWRRTR